jgi:putative colanic acid biosynthesis glycosyltransferase
MTEPLLSIITVTKNNAKGLRWTTKSIAVQQQSPEIEHIIIDGASTDNTQEIIQEYLNEKTKFISETDNGIYDAMNKGINQATGRYLWFLNAGDCLPDAYVLRDISREIKHNLAPDFIYGDARENGRIKSAHDASRYAWGMFTHHQAMLYRRQMIGNLRFDTDYKIAADYAFTLNVLALAKRMHYYKRNLCDFQSGGISQINSALGRKENFEIRRDLLNMPLFKNKMIYQLNGFTFALRQQLPWLYRLVRFSLPK